MLWTPKVDGVDLVMADHINKLQTYKMDKDEFPWVRAAEYGFSTLASRAVNKAALLAAIASIATKTGIGSGGKVLLPRGVFDIDADILLDYFNVTVEGAAEAYGYEACIPATTLVFGPGTDGIKIRACSLANPAIPSGYNVLKNLFLDGNDNVTTVLNLNGTSRISNVITRRGVNGIWCNEYVNFTHLEFVSSMSNTGYGILIDGIANTPITIHKSSIRENTGIGVAIIGAAGAVSMDNVVIEGNDKHGLYIYRTSAALQTGEHRFGQLWLEGNNRYGGGYKDIFITGYDMSAAGPNRIKFDVLLVSGDVQIDVGSYITFDNSVIQGDFTIGYAAHHVTLNDSAINGTYTDNNVSDEKTNRFNTPRLLRAQTSDDAFFSRPDFVFYRSRGSIDARTIVQEGDYLGQVLFQGHDGAYPIAGASIVAVVDAAPGGWAMPTRLDFSTSPIGSDTPTRRLSIKSNGTILVNADLVVGGPHVVINSPTEVEKDGEPAWGDAAWSECGYVNSCFLSFRAGRTDKTVVMGLNFEPTANAGYGNIDYCFMADNDGTALIYEKNVNIGHQGAYTTATVFSIVYDGVNVKYYMDGVLKRTVARAVGLALYLDSSFYHQGGLINHIVFGPGVTPPTEDWQDYAYANQTPADGGLIWGAEEGGGALAGWSYRKRIDLPLPAANLVDFPVKVPIVADADIGAACLASGFDIRFTADDGVTLLPHELVSFAVAGGEATGEFRVKSDVAVAGTYIWCYYGNATAPDVSTPILPATGPWLTTNFTIGDTDITGVYKVSGVQVVGAQGAAVADATGASDVVAQFNALLARCRAHGIIDT